MNAKGVLVVALVWKMTFELSFGSRTDMVATEAEEEVLLMRALTVPAALARKSMLVMCSAAGTASRETVCQMPEHG